MNEEYVLRAKALEAAIEHTRNQGDQFVSTSDLLIRAGKIEAFLRGEKPAGS